MTRNSLAATAAAVGLAGLIAQPAWSANVKITPLGSHEGEFCRRDRALMFEDPDGTRILYDAGQTVRGPEDERLGEVDAVLLSHVHGDHLGNAIASGPNAGTCAEPDSSVSVTPNSNSVNIVVAKNARFLVGGEMDSFFEKKVAGAGGASAQVELVRFGGMREVGGVKVASVPAVHTNGIDPAFLEGDLAETLKANGLTAYLGPPGGYVLQFSNGLAVYLSGDTGITAEQDAVVRRFFGAELAVMNIGGIFSTGPQEAAWVIDELVQPKAVILSHANKAATVDGKVQPGTKTEAFIEAVEVPAYVPLSGKTMEFDGEAACVSGCD
jgi:L-ascorbate metabolism protein UlaG (beta-lactamase superfamily)